MLGAIMVRVPLPTRPALVTLAFAAFWALLFLAPVAIPAQDGLYAPALDGAEAMVRVVNAGAAPERLRDVGPVRFGPVAVGTATPYRPIAPDFFIVGGRANGVLFEPVAGGYYTIVTTAESIVIFTDTVHNDPARAQIVLYNLTGAPLTLAVDGGPPVVGAVDPGTSADRAVNAVEVPLVVTRDGDDVQLWSGRVSLVRGQSDSVVAAGSTVFTVRASVDTRS